MTVKEYNDGVRTWADDVMRFAVRVCGHREHATTAADAVQEAFTGLWKHRDEVQGTKGKQYLMGAVHNQLMKSFGRRQREVVTEGIENGIMRVENDAMRMEMREAIEVAMQGLSEVQRAILQLKDVEGYSYHEIADILGVNENQVQVYLFRARVAMKKRLKQYGYE